MDRRKTKDVLWMAFQCAKYYKLSLIDAWGNDKSEKIVRDLYKDIAAIDCLQEQLFGTTKSKGDIILEKMTVISLPELAKRLNENI